MNGDTVDGSGASTSTTPANPIATAAIRTGPMRRPKNATEKSRTQIGAVNSPAATCATGRKPSAPK